MWVTSSPAKALTPTAIALGNFDGVHRGHQQVIQPMLSVVSPPQSMVNAYATVVTFNPHPQEFFTGQPRALLTPLDEKIQQLQKLGVEQLVLLPFDRELADLSPQQFVEKILVQQLDSQQISVGQDFHFGKGRSGTALELKAIAANYGVPVTIVPLHTCAGERISSSSIRQYLASGDLKSAKILLGRPYTLIGKVIKGQQLGRTIGFPTANLQLPPQKFLPQLGVYGVRVFNCHQNPIAPPQLGVMNIGCRPTVNGTSTTVEVHLLDWSGDLYGQTITVQPETFLRPEQKFTSLEALKAQIQADCEAARVVLGRGE